MRKPSLETFAEALRDMRADALDDMLGLERKPLALAVENGVATIPLKGVVGADVAEWEKVVFGLTDVKDFAALCDMAAEDPHVHSVALDINSPGGTVLGVPEAGDAVARLRSTKLVRAYTDGLCCSAAYWIASQAHEVVATKSAIVGSIGVYSVMYDTSRLYEQMGVKPVLIKAGKWKALGVGGLPVTDEQVAHEQTGVDYVYQLFTAAVTSTRPGVSTETMQGQDFYGAQAVTVGLVDRVVESVTRDIAEMSKETP